MSRFNCLFFLAAALATLTSTAAELPRYISPSDRTGSSAAVVVGDWPLVHTAQLLPLDDNGQVVGHAKQISHVLNRLHGLLTQADSGLKQVVKLNFYVTKPSLVSDVQKVLAKRFPEKHKPAVSFVVSRLPIPDAVVAVDAVASTNREPGRSVEHLAGSNAAIIPHGTRIYISGQAARNSSLAQATSQTLEGLRKTLQFLGRRDSDVVQLKAFLTPMSDVATVQREITTFFGNARVPPTVFVEWQSGSNVPIEIELIAWGGRHRSGETVEYLTPPGMKSSPVFSRVARINQSNSIYVSGLYASSSRSKTTGEGEVKEVFASLKEILKKAGSDLRHLAKATYYVSTDEASRKLNELRPQYYDPKRPPAASKAKVSNVGRQNLGLALDIIGVPAFNTKHAEYGPPEYGLGLSATEVAEGWISLFDGKTTFGWKNAKLDNGLLSGGMTTTQFGNCELKASFARAGAISIGNRKLNVPKGEFTLAETKAESAVPIHLDDKVQVETLVLRPLNLKKLDTGRDMSGWKRIDRLPEDRRPKWQMSGNAMRAIGGPGCIEYQGGHYGDMVLQLDIRTRIRHTNGGVFFRAIPGDFMNGYESQIYNRGLDSDPSRPVTWCTGGIDDRKNARRLVSRDHEFFRMTVIANGSHISTWINGYQQTDFTDQRPPHENPRRGRRTKAGAIQLQAHDPGTDVEFKNIAAAALK